MLISASSDFLGSVPIVPLHSGIEDEFEFGRWSSGVMEYAEGLSQRDSRTQPRVSTLGTRPIIKNRPERAADWESADAAAGDCTPAGDRYGSTLDESQGRPVPCAPQEW